MPPAEPLPLVVLVAGDPIAEAHRQRGGFGDLIRAAAEGAYRGQWVDVDLRARPDLPAPSSIAGAIVTGSAASVTDREDWTVRGEAYLRRLADARVPVLGICYGHQMLASAFGGEVTKNPRGREIGTVDLNVVRADALFCRPGTVRVNETHVDSVARLPPGASVLGRTALDDFAAIRFREHVWGVQFHPEIDAWVMRRYVEARRGPIAEEGLDPDAILAGIEDAPAGAAVLRRFIERVVSR